MKTINFDKAYFDSTGHLFPLEIANDHNIFFHGTSSINERGIDELGLVYFNTSNLKVWSELASGIIDNLRTFYITEKTKFHYNVFESGAILILKLYTENDFKKSNKGKYEKPIFLTFNDKSALLYALKSRAGGETIYALKELEKDLHNTINIYEDKEKKWQEQYLQEKKGHLELGFTEDRISPYEKPELSDFEKALVSLKGAFNYAKELESNHEYGCVYAIKLNEDDISNMQFDHSYVCLNKVPQSKILFKMKIPDNIDYAENSWDNAMMEKWDYWKDLVKRPN